MTHAGEYVYTNEQVKTAELIYDCVRDGDVERLSTVVQGNHHLVDVYQNPLMKNTALLRAVHGGNIGCVRVLIGCGANVDHQNKYGVTALMLAAVSNQPECIKLLLEHKADGDTLSKYGETALSLALKHQHSDCAEVMLAAVEEAQAFDEFENSDGGVDNYNDDNDGDDDDISFNVSQISDIISSSDYFNVICDDDDDFESETHLMVCEEQLSQLKDSLAANTFKRAFVHHRIDQILSSIKAIVNRQLRIFDTPDPTEQVASLNEEVNQIKMHKVALSQRLERVESVNSIRDEEINSLKSDQQTLLEQFQAVKAQLDAIRSTIIPSTPKAEKDSAPLPTTNFEDESLEVFLKRIHCESYLEEFASGGAICVHDLHGLPIDDLVNDFGMKKIEARRLLRSLPSTSGGGARHRHEHSVVMMSGL